jgi:NAD(P)-dependent dehydrogenase (short-subunit alcohol dehydrogenase family)
MSLIRKVIVITGASSGIGASLAHHLGKAGHPLVLAARRGDELTQVACDASPAAVPIVTDVTDRAAVEHLRDEAMRAFGRVDVWINNAGRGIDKPVLELTDADFDEVMAVNVKSALYGMQTIVPHFVERGQGHLINVSSFLARVPLATNRSAYNAAKAALNALTANLRVDLREKHPGIHVSVVMPGVVSTDFARNAIGDRGGAPTSPMPAQTVDEVALSIVELIGNPRPEIYTNPASAALARKYYEDVGAFEESRQAAASSTS